MRHPVMKIGKFQFHYVQVPYDDRYYIIKYDWFGLKEIAKFSAAAVRIIDDMIAMAVKKEDGAWSEMRSKQVEKFSSNKEKYDQYLDNQDEVAFSKLKAKEAKSKKK